MSSLSKEELLKKYQELDNTYVENISLYLNNKSSSLKKIYENVFLLLKYKREYINLLIQFGIYKLTSLNTNSYQTKEEINQILEDISLRLKLLDSCLDNYNYSVSNANSRLAIKIAFISIVLGILSIVFSIFF